MVLGNMFVTFLTVQSIHAFHRYGMALHHSQVFSIYMFFFLIKPPLSDKKLGVVTLHIVLEFTVKNKPVLFLLKI